jgi:hypothetical protein
LHCPILQVLRAALTADHCKYFCGTQVFFDGLPIFLRRLPRACKIDSMLTTERIIAAFGGREELAALIGAKPHAISEWVRIGIPFKHFHTLVDEAKARGIKGISYRALHSAKRATLNGNGRAA